jgi:hypothetical protein
MFISVIPTFSATSTKEGNPSVAERSREALSIKRKIEIGRILHLKSEIRNLELD